MHKKYLLLRDLRPLFTLAGVAVSTGLAAQPAPTDAAAADADEDLYVLSPFEVNSSKDAGYAATETLAGTRIRTDLKDVGSAISVVTKELMNDIGATDSSTLLQYTTNAEVAGTRGTYTGLGTGVTLDESASLINRTGGQRVRGLTSADNTRDFFVTDIPWDGYNVDRIDIQRGPNSMLFGLGSPAGIVNASLKDAQFGNLGSVEARFGSYGSTRGSLDVNRQIIDNVLAIRVDGLWNNEKYEQSSTYQHDHRAYVSVRWDPKLFGPEFATKIKVKYENGNVKANRPRIVTPYDSITPWFTSVADGGMGQLGISNLYALGSNAKATNNWLTGGVANQQQPIWFIDGTTANVYQIYGGFINTGARKADGTILGASSNLVNQLYADMFMSITDYSTYASNANLEGYSYGQYRNKCLTDSSIFNFYKNLIDGNTKHEWEDWNAWNFDFSQTGWGDRVGLEISYDYQSYERGGQSLLGGTPTISVDVTKVFQDFSTNPNFGRAFIKGGPGSGSSYKSDRRFVRATLFGEFRASDVFSNELLVKILGRQRFTGTFSHERFFYENRSWQMYAFPQSYSGYWNRNDGSLWSFRDRAPVSVIYLGSSTWNADSSIDYSDVWNLDPNSTLAQMFSSTTPPTQQCSNPANYVGWNSNYEMNLLTCNDGKNTQLLTLAQKAIRETESYAGSWQSFFWNESLVGTLGWRYDRVKSKSATAVTDTTNRSYLILDDTYALPEEFEDARTFRDHSTSGGVVLHLNKILEKDILPINVSVSWFDSSNFQVTGARSDLYGDPIANPTGHTKEFGLQLSTKDGRFSFRATKYETEVQGASLSMNYSLSSGFGSIVRQGLKWRNVFLYRLGGYDWGTRENRLTAEPDGNGQYAYRCNWFPAWTDASGYCVGDGDVNGDYDTADAATQPTGATHLQTAAEAKQMRDDCITAWNQIQSWLTDRGYFTAWNYNPTTLSALTDRTTYEQAMIAAGGTWQSTDVTTQYTPEISSVASYAETAPSGFSVTCDTESKGYEFEFTANPTKNWRITFNASKTDAMYMNVGGAAVQEFIDYMDTMIAGVAGEMREYNGHYTGQTLRRDYNTWRANYTLLKLQENAAASEIRKWRYNIVTNYSFSEGALKGVGVGAAYRWQDKVVIGYPTALDDNGRVTFDLDNPYYGPTEDGLDFWVSYERQLSDKLGWKIQLNIRNAFQSDGLIPVSVEPDGTTWAGVRIKPVQEWFITNTFTF